MGFHTLEALLAYGHHVTMSSLWLVASRQVYNGGREPVLALLGITHFGIQFFSISYGKSVHIVFAILTIYLLDGPSHLGNIFFFSWKVETLCVSVCVCLDSIAVLKCFLYASPFLIAFERQRQMWSIFFPLIYHILPRDNKNKRPNFLSREEMGGKKMWKTMRRMT